jgi:molybdopterin-guanine dinucleotide biosynthesis protein A
MEYCGIILSGGKSSRMGTDKGFIEFKGFPLIRYPLNLLSDFCSEVIISSNNKEYHQFGYPVIADKYLDYGPAGGLSSALSFSRYERNIVLSCDMPFVNRECIQYLISSEQKSTGVVPIHDGYPEPLVALYHRSIGPVLETSLQNGDYKLQSIIRQANIDFLDFSLFLETYPNVFVNINSPEDLVKY